MPTDELTTQRVILPPRALEPHGIPSIPREPIEERHWTFREVESILAGNYGIASSKRTTFAARLKNFHRLRFPLGFQAEQGKTAKYSAGHLAMMALALEMTNLGLQPERIVRVLTSEWYPTATALRMAATALLERPEGFDEHVEKPETDPMSMFIFFDPSALSPLRFEGDHRLYPDLDDAADSFFFGGQGVVRENLVRWTSGNCSRISMINVTSMLDRVVGMPDEDLTGDKLEAHMAYRRNFFRLVEYWAEDLEEMLSDEGGPTDAKIAYLWTYFIYLSPPGPWDAEKIEQTVKQAEHATAMGEDFIRSALNDYMEQGAPNVR